MRARPGEEAGRETTVVVHVMYEITGECPGLVLRELREAGEPPPFINSGEQMEIVLSFLDVPGGDSRLTELVLNARWAQSWQIAASLTPGVQ